MGEKILFSKRHPAQLIALVSLLFVGTMQFIRSSHAAGGGDGIDLQVTIRDGLGDQAVYVGLGILLFVYALLLQKLFTVH
jgi:hypothetical protein